MSGRTGAFALAALTRDLVPGGAGGSVLLWRGGPGHAATAPALVHGAQQR